MASIRSPLDSQLGTTASCHQRITRRRVPVNDVTVLDGHIGAAGIHQRKAGTVERSVLDVADTLVINDDTVGVRSFRSGESSSFDSQCSSLFVHENIIAGSHLSNTFDGKLFLVDDLLFADSQSNSSFKVDDGRFLDWNLATRFRNFRQIIMIPYIDVTTVF